MARSTNEVLSDVAAFLEKRCGGKDKERHRKKVAARMFGKFPALKVNDPEFILERLCAGQTAGFFSKNRLIAKIGQPQVLINSEGVPMAWAIVQQGGPVSTEDVAKFAEQVVDGVDPATRADFENEDSFYYIPLQLSEEFTTPVILKAHGAHIDFEADVAKSMVDPRSFAQDPGILDLISVPPEELLLLRGALIDLIGANPDNITLLKQAQRAHGLIVNELRARGVMPDPTEKAVWSRAFINDLPDSSFLLIESGGTKDAEGKTKPRSLRHFPVKGPDGKVDLPHLRNAIARIPQAKIPGFDAKAKERLQTKARRMLEEAQKATVGKCADRQRAVRIVKSAAAPGADVDERFVFGVVLVPNEADSQGEIYDADEVKKAAHAYMENANGTFKIMHNGEPIDGIRVLETYVTKVAETHDGETFPVGTWLMAARILDGMLWDQVKRGVFTGFSIGGTAIRESLR